MFRTISVLLLLALPVVAQEEGKPTIDDFIKFQTEWNRQKKDAKGNPVAEKEVASEYGKALAGWKGKEATGKLVFLKMTSLSTGFVMDFGQKEQAGLAVWQGIFPKERAKELAPLRKGDSVSVIAVFGQVEKGKAGSKAWQIKKIEKID